MSDQSTPPTGDPPAAPQVGDAGILKFSCTACGKPLTAPISAAGVVAPCPTCGADTQAPAVPGEPRPIAPKPRRFATTEPGPPVVAGVAAMPVPTSMPAPEEPAPKAPAPASPGQAPAPADAAAGSDGSDGRERRRRRRSQGGINPVTALSPDYEDRKELGALVRIFLAVALTAAIVAGVFYFMKKKVSGPSQPRVSGLVQEA